MRNTFFLRPRNPLARSRTFLWRACAVTPRLTLGICPLPYPEYGSMALTEARLLSWIEVPPRRWRFRLVDFLVRIWRRFALPRLMLPEPRTLNRFEALFFVFIFGMMLTLFFNRTPGGPL